MAARKARARSSRDSGRSSNGEACAAVAGGRSSNKVTVTRGATKVSSGAGRTCKDGSIRPLEWTVGTTVTFGDPLDASPSMGNKAETTFDKGAASTSRCTVGNHNNAGPMDVVADVEFGACRRPEKSDAAAARSRDRVSRHSNKLNDAAEKGAMRRNDGGNRLNAACVKENDTATRSRGAIGVVRAAGMGVGGINVNIGASGKARLYRGYCEQRGGDYEKEYRRQGDKEMLGRRYLLTR